MGIKKFEPIDHSSNPKLSSNQKGFLSIQADYSVAATKYESGRVGKFISVNLQNCRVGPGNLMHDQDDLRGFFLDRVKVQMWFQKQDDIHPDVSKRLTDIHLVKSAPEGAPNSSGNISSSISFSMNESAGAFGEIPTASVGSSVNIGHSFSHQITDFTYLNHSVTDLLDHEYIMTQSGSGQPYNIKSPGDAFVDSGQSPFVGVRLASIPSLAKSNFPVASQGVWMVKLGNKDKLEDQTVNLFIQLSGHYAHIEGTNNGFTISHKHQINKASTWYRKSIPLQDIQPS